MKYLSAEQKDKILNQDNIEKDSITAAHKFLHWMEAAHGFIPYGFHGDIKRFYLESINLFKSNNDKDINKLLTEINDLRSVVGIYKEALEELRLGHDHKDGQSHMRKLGDGYGWCDFCETRQEFSFIGYANEALSKADSILNEKED